jgi:flagellar FliJ protein
MKRFIFNLRPLSLLRAHRESRARDLFAAAVRARVKSEEELARTRARVAEFEAALFAGRRERFAAAAEALSLAAYRRESALEVTAERAVLAARAEMGRCRADYLEAHRKLEVVQRLEEKARAAHRLAASRAEQAEFDDFAGRRAVPPRFFRV